MEKPPSINIGTAASPITAVFGEANPEQRLACSKLGATAFLPPLTPAQYLQREEFMSTLPLTKGTGWRFWCLFNKDRPNQVFSTCRTIDRDLLVRDAQGETRRERGYCISSVVSDDEYRERGLASFLLGKVTEWMDGPGQAFASFLYTSNRSAFYASRGWDKPPSIESAIKLCNETLLSKHNLQQTRLLKAAEVPALCERDVQRLAAKVDGLTLNPGNLVIAVLPTANLVSWLHARSEFYTSKLYGKTPEFKGSISDSADVWIYWHHDYRRGQLTIQRVSCPARADDDGTESASEALASLLADARNEAAAWNLSKVAMWDPTPEVDGALRHLSTKGITDEIVFKTERRGAVTMMRPYGGLSGKVIFETNEHYAWN